MTREGEEGAGIMMTTVEVLRLLVRTLEQAEQHLPWNVLPSDYRMDALNEGRKCLGELEAEIEKAQDLE